jgi:tRNA pseudouridine55 synthase
MTKELITKSGFLLINKPIDLTSHTVISVLRGKLKTRKIGHAGTLDPKATGVLLCAIGNGLKFLEYLTANTTKTYIATIVLGKNSTTYDSEGEIIDVIDKDKINVNEETIKTVLKDNFLGKILQVPPIHSRVNVKGRPAYYYARKGEEITLPSREVEIFETEVLNIDENVLEIKLVVSKGFYVRSFAHDLGQVLQIGGYLKGLKRTAIENFNIEDSIFLEDVVWDKVLPLNFVLDLFNNVEVTEEERDILWRGNFIKRKLLNKKEISVAVCNGKIVSILKEIEPGVLKPHKNIIE